MPLTLADVASLTGGTVSDADPDVFVTGPVVADSRQVTPGALFVAIPGARTDGHAFVPAAVSAGAAAVLAARPVGVPAVVVDDPVTALGRLAHGYLTRLPQTTVVGVTGSSGKTSTKDLLGQVLSRRAATLVPAGSYNTEVGLPVTVLRADEQTRFLVLEMSARDIGHIAYLCGIARPDIGVVLNVGSAHLGIFGSREAIATAKGELVEALSDDGVAVLNADDRAVAAMSARTSARVVRFGTADADVVARDVTLDDLARPAFTLVAAGLEAAVRLRLHGRHHVSNALATAAVALELGMSVPDVAAALSEARPASHWRMEITASASGATIVNDAYNANPQSMLAALDALAAMHTGGASWAVLGEMAELGDAARAEHVAVGARVAMVGVDHLIAVGTAGEWIATGARDAGMPHDRITVVADVEGAVAALAPERGDVVLVKASRSVGLERVAEALLGVRA